jgi:coenzyme F420-reducing hydrogenase delta subunit
MYINGSVGLGGKNSTNDVKFIQELLNMLAEEDVRMPVLVVDGRAGRKTNAAIKKFQQLYVKLKSPDSRIDVNGRSEKTLLGKALEIDRAYLGDIARKYKLRKAGPAVHQKGPKTIKYRTNAKKVVSVYTENVVKLAMSYAGINTLDFSSTLRTFDDQARIMYNNCARFPSATSVDTLIASRGWGYAAPGREVEKVYFNKTSDGKDETIKAMKDKIEQLYKDGKQVSRHCVSEADYRKKNVVDIPYSSVTADKRKEFEIALMGMAQDIKNIRYNKPAVAEVYVTRLIIEDQCWHLEVAQLGKPLPNQTKPGNKKSKGKSQPTVFESFISMLDEWF